MLSDRDRAVLDFEASWWHYPAPKDLAIREHLGISATRYYQILRRIIDDPEALEHDPLTVRRIRKVRAEGRKRRVESRLGE
ncbi:MAG: DUF3263 domain-containing protein [Acidimicrobiia bacterium]